MSKMSKWFIREKKGKISKKDLFLIPTIKVWYNKRTFLETGVHTPAVRGNNFTYSYLNSQ